MASRGDKKKRWQERTASMRPVLGQPDLYDIKIATQSLPSPEQEFYSNTAMVHERRNFVSFVFGQLVGGTSFVQNAVSVDVPYVTLAAMVNTFDGPFRAALEKSLMGTGPIDPYLASPTNPPQPFACAAHIARAVINQIAGILDFYELLPALGAAPQVAPVIRIKTPPSVIRFFVTECDRILSELPARRDGMQQETPR